MMRKEIKIDRSNWNKTTKDLIENCFSQNEKGVVVIYGANGAGKTSIAKAFHEYNKSRNDDSNSRFRPDDVIVILCYSDLAGEYSLPDGVIEGMKKEAESRAKEEGIVEKVIKRSGCEYIRLREIFGAEDGKGILPKLRECVKNIVDNIQEYDLYEQWYDTYEGKIISYKMDIAWSEDITIDGANIVDAPEEKLRHIYTELEKKIEELESQRKAEILDEILYGLELRDQVKKLVLDSNKRETEVFCIYIEMLIMMHNKDIISNMFDIPEEKLEDICAKLKDGFNNIAGRKQSWTGPVIAMDEKEQNKLIESALKVLDDDHLQKVKDLFATIIGEIIKRLYFHNLYPSYKIALDRNLLLNPADFKKNLLAIIYFLGNHTLKKPTNDDNRKDNHNFWKDNRNLLINICCEDEIKELMDYNQPNSDVEQEIEMFKEAFGLPIDIKFSSDKQKIVYYRNGEGKECSLEDIQKKLSLGQRRSLYLMHILLGIEYRKNEKTLIIADDIVDSFDYRNKNTIIQYLSNIANKENVSLAIMTHNFDFYRSMYYALDDDIRKKSEFYIMERNIDEGSDKITISKDDYCGQCPMAKWIKELKKDNNKLKMVDSMLLALVPFARNIAFLSNDEGKHALTAMLHIKTFGRKSEDNTEKKKISDIVAVIESRFGELKLDKEGLKEKEWLPTLYEQADAICKTKAKNSASSEAVIYLNLEEKIVISMAIRLKSEMFMRESIKNKLKESIKIKEIEGAEHLEDKDYQSYEKDMQNVMKDFVEVLKKFKIPHDYTQEDEKRDKICERYKEKIKEMIEELKVVRKSSVKATALQKIVGLIKGMKSNMETEGGGKVENDNRGNNSSKVDTLRTQLNERLEKEWHIYRFMREGEYNLERRSDLYAVKDIKSLRRILSYDNSEIANVESDVIEYLDEFFRIIIYVEKPAIAMLKYNNERELVYSDSNNRAKSVLDKITTSEIFSTLKIEIADNIIKWLGLKEEKIDPLNALIYGYKQFLDNRESINKRLEEYKPVLDKYKEAKKEIEHEIDMALNQILTSKGSAGQTHDLLRIYEQYCIDANIERPEGQINKKDVQLLSILKKASKATGSLIHINDFFYEPLLDLHGEEQIKLYGKISELYGKISEQKDN